MTSLTQFATHPAATLAQVQTRICGTSEDITEPKRDALVVRSEHFANVARGLAAVFRARVQA